MGRRRRLPLTVPPSRSTTWLASRCLSLTSDRGPSRPCGVRDGWIRSRSRMSACPILQARPRLRQRTRFYCRRCRLLFSRNWPATEKDSCPGWQRMHTRARARARILDSATRCLDERSISGAENKTKQLKDSRQENRSDSQVANGREENAKRRLRVPRVWKDVYSRRRTRLSSPPRPRRSRRNSTGENRPSPGQQRRRRQRPRRRQRNARR